jgi:hypothetical protein
MNKLVGAFFSIVVSFVNVSCSTAIDDYESSGKRFDITKYFNGSIVGWGMVQDYSKKVNRRFCVEIEGSWNGNKGLLAETFYFNDGEVSYRNWQLTKQENGSYLATAEDVKGIAVGVHKGFAFQFTYNLLLTLDDEIYNVSMDDWMYQLDKYRVMNVTSMHKFGVKVADITLFFDKTLPIKQCSPEFGR